MYKFEKSFRFIDKILEENNYSRILLQFPDGLLGEFCTKIIKYLENKIEFILSGDPSYGACDLPTHQATIFEVDAIFHFGHSTFAFPSSKWQSNTGILIYYFPVEADVIIQWDKISKKILEMGWKTVGLITTIQHSSIINQAQQWLSKDNIKPIIHRKGQILGCNQDRAMKIANKVDGFLVIAGGDFHASPIVIATNRPTIRYDPFNISFKIFDQNYRNLYLKKRYAMILKARDAKIWGILLAVKSGQLPSDHGQSILKLIQKHGRIGIIIPMTRIDPSHLINMELIDAWVINLCPRIATDDFISFSKPILTTRELAVALGTLSWERFAKPNPEFEEQLLILES